MTKSPDYFKDKTILITGAASGIGEATARGASPTRSRRRAWARKRSPST